MKINTYHRSDCARAQGLCVIIDVLRAFTTAAFAFARGAKEIVLVSTVDEAFKKHCSDDSILLMGEEEGYFIDGFHFGNSPAEMLGAMLVGRRLVQRTSSGTQGAVACRHAEQMLITSFVVAEATLERIRELQPSHVSLIVTGRKNGDEDMALAEYLQLRLEGKNVSIEPYLERVSASPGAHKMLAADPSEYAYGAKDLELAMKPNCFPFAMEVFKEGDDLTAKVVKKGSWERPSDFMRVGR